MKKNKKGIEMASGTLGVLILVILIVILLIVVNRDFILKRVPKATEDVAFKNIDEASKKLSWGEKDSDNDGIPDATDKCCPAACAPPVGSTVTQQGDLIGCTPTQGVTSCEQATCNAKTI